MWRKFVIEVFNEWQLRALILFSLSLQIMLAVFGSMRKRSSSKWVKMLVWVAYSAADSSATVALGIVARAFDSSSSEAVAAALPPDTSLLSFWAMFLFLHLGGPDTITANDLVDNDLWHRHLVVLVFQIGVALYIFFSSWYSQLSRLAVPVFVAGVLKFGERTWSLRSSSINHFRNSLIMSTKFKDLDDININDDDGHFPNYLGLGAPDFLFKRLRYLFAGIKLPISEGRNCRQVILLHSTNTTSNSIVDKAFRMVEFELGLLYDQLYTKATMVNSAPGILLRCISLLATASALVTFPIIIDQDDYGHFVIDIYITYVLVCGALILELHSFFNLIHSDWTKLWLLRGRCRGLGLAFVDQDKVLNRKRWSRSISRFNLVAFCIKKEAFMPKWVKENYEKALPLFIREKLDKFDHNVIRVDKVDPDIQRFIFNQLHAKIPTSDHDDSKAKAVLDYKGDFVLKEQNQDRLLWSIVNVEFDHSLLLWHIATDLCYYDDIMNSGLSDTRIDEYSKISKCLSDYMLYLLFKHPNMLPKGVRDDIRLREATEDAIKFVGERGIDEIQGFYQQLMEEGKHLMSSPPMRGRDHDHHTRIDIEIEEVSPPTSILQGGCKLAYQLQQGQGDCKKKWEMMNGVWVELLTYAAGHCEWIEHAKMLTSGGELLTHVCLLMANFGFSDLYQTRDTRSLYSSTQLLANKKRSARGVGMKK